MYEIPPAGKPRLRPLSCVAALAALALFLGMALTLRRCRWSELPPEGDDIRAMALQLDRDPARIEAFMGEVGRESYAGVLRGPLGTLWSMGGNEADRESLRQALLAEARRGPRPALPPGERHVVRVALIVDGETAKPRFEVELPSPTCTGLFLALSTATPAEGMRVVFLMGDQAHVTPIDPRAARRLDARFRFESPGRAAVERTREIFTRTDPDWPALDDPRNRTTFVVTTGWVSEWAAARRVEESAGQEVWRRRHAAVAFPFLAAADALTRRVAADFGVTASVASPRVTVIATEWGPSGRPAMSIDLRRDDVEVEGDAARVAAFHAVRSSLRASLESRALQIASGGAALSAADLLADAWERRTATLAGQADLLERTLRRFRDPSTPEGSTLEIRGEGHDGPPVAVSRSGAGVSVGGGAAEADLRRAALAVLERVGDTAGRPLVVGCREPVGRRWYDGARVFSYGGAESSLVFERQFLRLEPGLDVETVDYWDDIAGKFHESVLRGSWTIDQEELENARVLTLWLHGNRAFHKGRMWDGISRAAYRELKSAGKTTLRYRNQEGVDSDPITYWETAAWKMKLTLNNREFQVPVITIEGDWEKNNAPKPEAWKSPILKDPKDGFVISRWTLLDDPEYPVFFRDGDCIQTVIPGTVTDAHSGRGVDDARVAIVGTSSETSSWPDGGFSLPLVRQPYREFEVRASAPGYAPWSATLDFRAADAFPIRVVMEPEARSETFAWIEAGNAAAVLPGLPLGARSRRLIGEVLVERPGVVVMVPLFPVVAEEGPVEAWVEISPETGECWPRMSDGLYGSTLADWLISKAAPKPWTGQHHAISYFSGRIAAWYLHAAGALDAVGTVVDGAEMSLPEMHRHAARVARALARMYDHAVLKVPGNPLVKGGSLQRGLEDGLQWADRYYGEVWK